jgi:hypothetical protein
MWCTRRRCGPRGRRGGCGRVSTITLGRLALGSASRGATLRRSVRLPRRRIRRAWSAETLPTRSTLRSWRTIVTRHALARSRLAEPLQTTLPLARSRTAGSGRRRPIILTRWVVGRLAEAMVGSPVAGSGMSIGGSLPGSISLTREELRIAAGSRHISDRPVGKAPAGYAWIERDTAVYQTRCLYLTTRHVLHVLKTATREIFRSHACNRIRDASISVYSRYIYVGNVNATV